MQLLTEAIGGDRRSNRRYEARLRLRYHVLDPVGRRAGWGCTDNLSRTGALFRTDSALHFGSRVELVIEWPFLLQNVCGMELVMLGTVCRSGERIAIHASSYHLRTCGRRSFEGYRETVGDFLATA